MQVIKLQLYTKLKVQKIFYLFSLLVKAGMSERAFESEKLFHSKINKMNGTESFWNGFGRFNLHQAFRKEGSEKSWTKSEMLQMSFNDSNLLSLGYLEQLMQSGRKEIFSVWRFTTNTT